MDKVHDVTRKVPRSSLEHTRGTWLAAIPAKGIGVALGGERRGWAGAKRPRGQAARSDSESEALGGRLNTLKNPPVAPPDPVCAQEVSSEAAPQTDETRVEANGVLAKP